MTTLATLSQLSAFVYKDINMLARTPALRRGIVCQIHCNDFTRHQTALRDGWYEVLICPGMQLMTTRSLYASLFIRCHLQKPAEAVLAVRGTVITNLSNIAQDIKVWYKAFVLGDTATLPVPSYLDRLSLFARRARAYTKGLGIPHRKFTLCGHSLGGALAALLSTHKSMPYHTATFNAPGIKHIRHGSFAMIHDAPIVNIRARYDFISTLGEPVGPVYAVDVPEHQEAASLAFAAAELAHSKFLTPRMSALDKMTQELGFTASCMAQHSIVNLMQVLSDSTQSTLGKVPLSSLLVPTQHSP